MSRPDGTTPSIHAALGLSAEDVDDALTWARGRAAELLASLDDAELGALLGRELAPSPPRAPPPAPARIPPLPPVPARAVPSRIPPLPPPPPARPLARPGAPPSTRPSAPPPLAASVPPPLAASVPPPLAASVPPPSSRVASVPPPSPLVASTPPPSPPPPPPPRAAAARSVPGPEPDAPAARTDHTRRRAQRYSLSTPVVVRLDSFPELLALNTRDISLHGLFIETNAPPEPDARISVQLPFPDGSGVVQLVGEVVRVVTTRQAAASGGVPGFGVSFAAVSDESRRDLERLIEHAKAGAAADVPRRRGNAVTQARTVVHAHAPRAKASKG